MKHCIVTPEIPPITENGGVATNARNLARFLSVGANHEVTVLSTAFILVFLGPRLANVPLAFVGIVLAGKYLRKLIMRKEDYYDQ